MKKLMFAVAAVAAGVALADVTSANIVGYQNLSNDGCESPSIGATFVPLSGESTYKLGELKGIETDPDNDVLQLLDPDTTDTLNTFGYCSPEAAAMAEKIAKVEPGTYAAWIGWWEVTDGFDPSDDDLRADDVDINVGQGFLGLMADDIQFTSSGEAPQEPVEIATDGCESPYIANMIPREIKLGWIKGTDTDPDNDVFQLLDPDTTDTLATYGYCSPEAAAMAEKIAKVEPGTYDAWIGWWEVTDGFDPSDDDLRADDVDVPAGQAFLGLMADDVIYAFPSALYNGEDAE